MNEMRKLMEAVEQLDEYLVREGESIETLLRLNVFGDMGFGDDPELFSDDPDNGVEMSEAWAEVIYDNQPEAEERYLQIKGEAENGRKLTNAEARVAENTWYDGSDAYQSEEEAAEHLPGVYANQLNVVENILHGLVDDEWIDEGKYNYPQGMKGKGAAYKEPGGKGQKGAGNRKSRKAFRKAQRAEQHAARMRGEVDEDVGNVYETRSAKETFLAGWEWALATPWEDQMKAEEAFERYDNGEQPPENY